MKNSIWLASRATIIGGCLFLAQSGFAGTEAAEQWEHKQQQLVEGCAQTSEYGDKAEFYNLCDEEGKNQATIFNEVAKSAKASGKKVVIILGADWCPPCRSLGRMLKNDLEGVGAILEKAEIVKVSSDTKSGNQLVKDLNLKESNGIPTIYLVSVDSVDGTTSKVTQVDMQVGAFSNIREFQNFVK